MIDQGLVRIYRMPGGTNAQYDEVVAAAGDVIAAGAEVHLAGSNESDLWVIEVWPSTEALAAWQASQAESEHNQVVFSHNDNRSLDKACGSGVTADIGGVSPQLSS